MTNRHFVRIAIVLLLAGNVGATAVVKSKSNISNNRASAPAAYVTVRPVIAQPDAKHTQRAHVDTEDVYFDPSEVLLDLSVMDYAHVTIEKQMVIVPLTANGAKALHAWSSNHVGKELGIFVDGKLVDAPLINSVLDGPIVIIGGFSAAQANEIAKRIRRGGAASQN